MEKREERVMDKKISGYRMLQGREEYSGKEDAGTDGFAADSSGTWILPAGVGETRIKGV